MTELKVDAVRITGMGDFIRKHWILLVWYGWVAVLLAIIVYYSWD